MLAWLFGFSALCWLGESNRLYAQFGDRGDRREDRVIAAVTGTWWF